MKLFKAAIETTVLGTILTASALGSPEKFGDLPLGTKFYFPADTRHSYPWTKISATSGSNTVNHAVAPINAPTLVDSVMPAQDSVRPAQYTCPMHPGVVQESQGVCPTCGMTLVKKR